MNVRVQFLYSTFVKMIYSSSWNMWFRNYFTFELESLLKLFWGLILKPLKLVDVYINWEQGAKMTDCFHFHSVSLSLCKSNSLSGQLPFQHRMINEKEGKWKRRGKLLKKLFELSLCFCIFDLNEDKKDLRKLKQFGNGKLDGFSWSSCFIIQMRHLQSFNPLS